MGILNEIVRGAGRLPHVGSHPGWPFFGVFTMIGACAGLEGQGSISAAILGGMIACAMVAPIFVHGCISRARTSDRLEGKGRS